MITQPFVPSPSLARLLLWGALATLLTGGLSAASFAIEWLQGRPQAGLTMHGLLDAATIAPGVVVLLTWLHLSQATSSKSLYRSSLGYWITISLKKLIYLANPPKGSDLELIVGLLSLLLLIADIGYSLWFTVSLLRLRRQLGGTAVALAVVELLTLVSWLGIKCVPIFTLLEVADNPAVGDDQMDAVLAPYERWILLHSTVASILITLFRLIFFLALRDRASEPARAEESLP